MAVKEGGDGDFELYLRSLSLRIAHKAPFAFFASLELSYSPTDDRSEAVKGEVMVVRFFVLPHSVIQTSPC